MRIYIFYPLLFMAAFWVVALFGSEALGACHLDNYLRPENEGSNTSGTSVNFYQTTQCNNTEGSNLCIISSIINKI
jgi:hypothetical protein